MRGVGCAEGATNGLSPHSATNGIGFAVCVGVFQYPAKHSVQAVFALDRRVERGHRSAAGRRAPHKGHVDQRARRISDFEAVSQAVGVVSVGN